MEPCDDWASLQPGNKIIVQNYPGDWATAVVEGRTADGDVIWVRDNLNDRRLLYRGDGFKIVGASNDVLADDSPAPSSSHRTTPR